MSSASVPDADLDLMRPGQSLSNLTCSALTAVGDYLKAERPDLVLVQGDTTTVFATTLAASTKKFRLVMWRRGSVQEI